MPKRPAAAKPEPVPVNVVCSLCGESWVLHQQDDNGEVTTLECIRLLKARATQIPCIVPQPYPVYPQRMWPYWTITSGTNLDNINCATQAGLVDQAYNTATPKILAASAA